MKRHLPTCLTPCGLATERARMHASRSHIAHPPSPTHRAMSLPATARTSDTGISSARSMSSTESSLASLTLQQTPTAAAAAPSSPAAPRSLDDDELEAIEAEVALQLRACVPSLTPFQALLVQEQLDLEPSRLYARLCAYVRNVQDVEAFATAAATKKPVPGEEPEAEEAQTTGAPTETTVTSGAAAAPAAAAIAAPTAGAPVPPAAPHSTAGDAGIAHGSAASEILQAPVLSHPTFLAALQDHLLHLLEERWDSVFMNGGSNGSSVSCNDGKRISKAERARKGLNKSSLVYGEVALTTLGEVLWGPHCTTVPTEGAVFVDLGSGTGRGVLAAAAVFPFARLVGVEILEGLHAAALDVAAHYERSVRPTFTQPGDPRATAKIELLCGSFLELDWPAAADVVFANSTCFDEQLMDDIATHGQALRDGAVVITLTRALNSPWFRLVYSEQHQMSWGAATINVAIKRTPTPDEVARALAEQQAIRRRRRMGDLD